MREIVLAHFTVLFYFVFNFAGSIILQDKSILHKNSVLSGTWKICTKLISQWLQFL